MVSVTDFRKTALALPKVIEKPHFDRASFRVDAPKGKTVCTLLESEATANFPLNLDMQEMLCAAEPEVFYPVPNKWGEKGWTTFVLAKADQATLESTLHMAWKNAAPPKLHALLKE